MTVLVTGGVGYIGSHMVLALLRSGEKDIVIADSLVRSQCSVYLALVKEAHRLKMPPPVLVELDLTNIQGVNRMFQKYQNIDTVYHFAAYKSVPESMTQPLSYYQNNLVSTMNILANCTNVKSFVFSSSASVYGYVNSIRLIDEKHPVAPASVYAETKCICEEIIESYALVKSNFHYANLRYFNPVGADPRGVVGERPIGKPSNLMPYVADVAYGERSCVEIYGKDWNTPDGTAIRDYIHVEDVCDAHLVASKHILAWDSITVNIGTGSGYSVQEVIEEYRKVSGKEIRTIVKGRRDGDVMSLVADTSKALTVLGWKAKHSLTDMCKDSWSFRRSLKENNEVSA
jgi:UDP-glucose 4-epimerase